MFTAEGPSPSVSDSCLEVAWQRGRLGTGGGTQVLSLQIGLIRHGQGARAEMGHPQRVAHSPGDERWQPSPNRISTPSLSPTLWSVFVCVTEWLGACGWGGGAALALINGPLIWFSIFLGCVYYLLWRWRQFKREVVKSNVVALHDNWIDGAPGDMRHRF